MKIFTRLTALLTILVLVSSAISVHAVPAWYGGEIKRIHVYSDGFVMTVYSTALDDCKHDYIYFKTSLLGHEQVDRMYSLALLARSLGEPVEFVIDKAVNGPEGFCNSNGAIDMGPKG